MAWNGIPAIFVKYLLRAGMCGAMLLFLSLIDGVCAEELPPLTELNIEELLNIEVYSASKFSQKLSEAPSSVIVVTADEIKKYGYRTLAGILQSVRGFYTTYDRNYSYLGIRGFSRPGDYNTRILLLVDGIRINDNIYDQAYIGSDFPIDVDLIDRVEVITGPGSSLYGSNAFFAVVNVLTRRAQDLSRAEVSVEAGSNAAYKTRASFGKIFDTGMEVALSGSYYDSQGNRGLYFKEFDDPATNNGIAEDLDNDRFTDLFGALSFKDFTLQGAYSERKKVVPTAAFGTVFNDNRALTRDTTFFVDLRHEHAFSSDLIVMTRINYNFHKFEGDYPYDYSEPGDPQFIVVNKDYAVGEWWAAEFQITRTLFDKHKLMVGSEFRENFRQDQKNYDTEVYLDDQRKSRVWAVYVQDEFTISKHLVLNAGVRYDYYSTFGSTTNPRLALIYNPFEKTTFKLIYGTAFRAPTAYEYYYGGGFGYKVNPRLRPETIRTYEMICEQTIGRNIRASVGGFYNKIEDLITFAADANDGLLVFKNIGTVEAKGLEFALDGKWENGPQGRASYTYQETTDKQTGLSLTNSPKHLAKLNLLVPLFRERISVGFEEQYTSRRKTLKDNHTNSSYVTNITLYIRNLLESLEASASVYNLFDDHYGDPGSDEHPQDIIEQNGRTFRGKLTYRF